MRPFWKKMLSCAMAFVCLTGAAAGLTGCHGSKEKAAFEVPESFDTTKQYQITFWQNLQRRYYEYCDADDAECLHHLPGPYCNVFNRQSGSRTSG